MQIKITLPYTVKQVTDRSLIVELMDSLDAPFIDGDELARAFNFLSEEQHDELVNKLNALALIEAIRLGTRATIMPEKPS